MKQVLFILFVFLVVFTANTQTWRDSLEHGKKMYAEGKYEDAYESMVEAQKLAPEGIDLSKDIGNAAYRKGDYEMAEKAFRSVAAGEEDPGEASKQWHNVGNSQLKRKDYQAAIESYKEALRKDPTNENARYNLAEAKRRLKKQQQEQQQKQDQQQKEKDKNQNQSNDNQQSQGDQQQDQQKQEGQQGNQNDQKNQSENKGENQQGKNGQLDQEKLSSKKTERMLDELLKKEMKTKRKAVGTKSGGSEEVKSGKKW